MMPSLRNSHVTTHRRAIATVAWLCAGLWLLAAGGAQAHKRTQGALVNPQGMQTTDADSATGDGADWQSDPALASQLGTETTMEGYAIQLPSEYVPLKTIVRNVPKATISGYLWKGLKRPDGSAPSILVMIGVPHEGYYPVDLFQILQAAANVSPHAVRSVKELGWVNNLQMSRQYFKYRSSVSKRVFHGFAYVATDANNILCIMADDTEPYSKTSLPIAEAAALTFHMVEEAAPPEPDAATLAQTAQAEIQAIYNAQDNALAHKDINLSVRGLAPNFLQIKESGEQVTLAQTQHSLVPFFYHGSEIAGQTQITKLMLTGKTATAYTSSHLTYNLINTTSNPEPGVSAAFVDDSTWEDFWAKTSSGWLCYRSQRLTSTETINGVSN